MNFTSAMGIIYSTTTIVPSTGNVEKKGHWYECTKDAAAKDFFPMLCGKHITFEFQIRYLNSEKTTIGQKYNDGLELVRLARNQEGITWEKVLNELHAVARSRYGQNCINPDVFENQSLLNLQEEVPREVIFCPTIGMFRARGRDTDGTLHIRPLVEEVNRYEVQPVSAAAVLTAAIAFRISLGLPRNPECIGSIEDPGDLLRGKNALVLPGHLCIKSDGKGLTITENKSDLLPNNPCFVVAGQSEILLRI